MVIRKDVHALLHLIDNISDLQRELIDYPNMKKQNLQVKTIGGLIDSLENIQFNIYNLTEKIPKIERVDNSINRWIKQLDKSYSDEENGSLPFYLSKEDASNLEKSIDKWRDIIVESFDHEGTSILKEDSLNDFITKELKNHLDEFSIQDLEDGIKVLLHSYPTPAALILYRVAEKIIQNFYEKKTGKKPDKKTWGQMLKDLEETGKVKRSLLGYLYLLNENRIKSAHPYRRYSQDESERILLQLKDLIDEIYP